jgi:monofunctional glycosyltransferase
VSGPVRGSAGGAGDTGGAGGAGGYPEGVVVETGSVRRPRGPVVRVLRAVLFVLLGYYAFCLLLLVAYRFVMPPVTGVQLQRGVGAAVTGGPHAWGRRHVPLDALPAHVHRAVVAAEDGRFWSHRGFDWDEMRIARRQAGGVASMRGASTITQQLMKNLFFTTHRNPVRKLYDLALTPPAELVLGKNRILEIYLNRVEWGPGIFGIEAAARHHYGKGATALTRTEAAGLAALLPNPRQRTPGNTGQYRATILRRMGARGW